MNRLAGQRGVTVIELVVALVVGVISMIGLYELMDASNRLTRQQTDVAEAQDAVRVGLSAAGRVIRQARVGGLYFGNAILPAVNNAPGGTSLTDLDGARHFIRQGTDVIRVRGIIQGDLYALSPVDVTCTPCDGTAAMTVTIPSVTASGIQNFPNGGTPSIARATAPFYFVVQDGTNQIVTANGVNVLVPLYFVGRVDTTGSWYTQTSTTFTFTMDPSDTGARKLDAPGTGSPVLTKPVTGGAVDDITFFVDEGPADATGTVTDTHPSLAEALLDPTSGNYRVQTLVEEVEDFQVAYGVDGIDGSTPDGGLSPVRVDTSASNKDEWVGNVDGEIEATLPISGTTSPQVQAFVDTAGPVATGGQLATAALRSVWISLVVKAAHPDMVYDGPGARGIRILDSAAVSFSSPSITNRPYRRRALSLAVSLRNYP
ncbi:MAG TPA: PilW family protein [Thermoanaerobaculia bacterium]|nr:PilW family protein [Thermoanaerobaculia bacterium]